VVSHKDTQLNVKRLADSAGKWINIGGTLCHACDSYQRQAGEEFIGAGTLTWTPTILGSAYLTDAIDKTTD
jgi:hypothetical protein